MLPEHWSPRFEMDYVAQTSHAELLARHREHASIFGLDAICADLPDGAIVLEVGCGAAGGLLNCVPTRLRRLACDPLIREYPWLPEGVAYFDDLVTALSQPDGSVDVLIAVEVLDHLPSIGAFRAAQRELCRVLKPGGTLVFFMPERPAECDGHPIAPCGKDVRRWLEETGFSVTPLNPNKEGIWCLGWKR